MYLEPSPKRIRVELFGETVADSVRAMLLLESGVHPIYYLPPQDLRTDLLEPTEHHTHCPKKGDASYYSVRVGDRVAENVAWYYPEPLDHAPDGLAGLVAFYLDRVDRMLEEDEEIVGHVRDPYHRLDILPSSRSVRLRHGDEVLAESRRVVALFETGLQTRWYLPREDVRAELLASESHTICPYKGTASYHSVRLRSGEVLEDVVWYYPSSHPEAADVAGLVCFYDEKLELELDVA